MSSKLLTHLSQSFSIDKPCFVTKVDLYFSSKDSSIPFKFNLRKNKQGMPTREILNFSEVVVDAANVNISSNANVETTVTFESPVYLEVGEYSLNLGSDSRDYNVYVATLNDTDITTTRKITQQPLIGSFFQTENLSTFIPSTFDDLKFKLYRAKFDTTVTSTVDIVPAYLEDAVSGIDGTLESDPFELFKDRSTVKVYQPNHGYAQGSFVKFYGVANTCSNIRSTTADVASGLGHDSGMEGGNIFGLDGNVFNKVFEISNVKLNSYTVDIGSGNIPVLTDPKVRFGGETPTIAINRTFNALTPTLSVYKTGNTTLNHKVKTTTLGSTYTKDTKYTTVRNLNTNDFDTEKTLASLINIENKLSNSVSFEYLVEMNTNDNRISPMVDTQQMGMFLRRDLVNNTNYTATVLNHELTTLSNIGDGNQGGHKANIYVTSGNFGVINLTTTDDMNNANGIINGSFLNVQANTSQTVGSGANNSGLYRVIDVVTGDSNNVNIKVAKISGDVEEDIANNNVYSILHTNDYIAEEAATGGTTYSKYITREVTFNNPSTGIRFLIDAFVPLNSNLDFYYKTKLAGDNTNLRDIEYKKVTGVIIPNSLDGNFVEVNHQIDDIDAFNSVIFKIVFNASSTSNSPKIKNFRLIAVS